MENKKEKKENVLLSDNQLDKVSGGFRPVKSSLDNNDNIFACHEYDKCSSCDSFLCPYNPLNPTIDPKDLYPDF